jgi:tripartite-type tricarboxylate transporter receptor subunit TctC
MLSRLTMRTHRVQIALVCVVAAVGLAAGDLAAQPYPAKSVRVVIPAAPGSNTDVFFRIVAQGGKARSVTLPDVPTMQEAGVPGFFVNSTFGFLGPAGLPRAIVDSLNAALARTVQDPATRKILLENGADPLGNTPEEHHTFITSEVARWTRVA